LPSKDLQDRTEMVLSEVFKEIARKCEVNHAIGQKIELRDAPDHSLDAWTQKLRELRPDIKRDSAFRDHVVDEVSIAAPKIKHAIVRVYQAAKVEAPQGLPHHITPGIWRQPGFMIGGTCHPSDPLQPKTRPRIIRQPTLKARQLFTLPPLLTPTR